MSATFNGNPLMSTCLAKVWNAIDKLSIIWKSDLSNKMGFLPSCSCIHTIIWMHHMDTTKTNREKARWEQHMLCAVLNKLWKQHPIKQQPYGHLPPISQTIQIR